MDSAPENSPLPAADDILFEHDVQRLGRDLHGRLKGKSPGLFEAAYWQGLLLDRAMRDPSLKTDLFRLVDALPALSSSEAIARHAREYLLAGQRELPTGLGLALRATENPLAASLSAFVIKRNVRAMAGRFIVGHDAREACPALQRLWNQGFGLPSICSAKQRSMRPSRKRTRSVMPISSTTSRSKPRSGNRGRCSTTVPRGPIPRANISLKLSAMDHLLDPADPAGGVQRLLRRVRPLIVRAKELGAFINFDLEQWNLHEITYRLFETISTDPEFASWPHLGIVIQAYLKDADADLDRMVALASKRNAPLTVRLVKGAYWDYEVVQSGLGGFPCPVFTTKGQTDANYERLTRRLFENRDKIHAAFGTHNLRTISVALACAGKLASSPAPMNFRCSTAWPSRSASCCATSAIACASTRPWAICSPAWLTWCAVCSKTRQIRVSCASATTITSTSPNCSSGRGPIHPKGNRERTFREKIFAPVSKIARSRILPTPRRAPRSRRP